MILTHTPHMLSVVSDAIEREREREREQTYLEQQRADNVAGQNAGSRFAR